MQLQEFNQSLAFWSECSINHPFQMLYCYWIFNYCMNQHVNRLIYGRFFFAHSIRISNSFTCSVFFCGWNLTISYYWIIFCGVENYGDCPFVFFFFAPVTINSILSIWQYQSLSNNKIDFFWYNIHSINQCNWSITKSTKQHSVSWSAGE